MRRGPPRAPRGVSAYTAVGRATQRGRPVQRPPTAARPRPHGGDDYARVDRELFTRLAALARDPSKPFFDGGSPASAGYRRLLGRISRFEPNTDQFRLRSFGQ